MTGDPPLRPGAPLVTPASANPVLDPTTQRFIDALADAGKLPLESSSAAEARAWLVEIQSGPVDKPPVDCIDLTLPIGPTGSLELRIVRPEGATAPLPVVLYCHGGGWIMGDRHTHDRLIRELAVGANAAIVFVDYTRAPEALDPVQTEQADAALRYIVANAAALHLDPARLAVAGDGSGGTMAIALALATKRRKGPPIALQLLFYPNTDGISDRGSFKTFENGPWMTLPVLRSFCAAAFPGGTGLIVNPLRTALADLEDMPPTLLITAENDMLRDDGEAYGRRLMQAGVSVVATRYNGTIRDFVMLDALAETPAARAAIAQATEGLRAALHP